MKNNNLYLEILFNEHSWKSLGAISPSKNFCIEAMKDAQVHALKELIKRQYDESIALLSGQITYTRSISEIALELIKEIES